MITFLNIENFRAISKLEYKPKQINIIIGRNNAGKSSLLNAISVALTGKFSQTDSYKDVFFRIDNESLLRIYGVKIGATKAQISSDRHTVTLYKFGTEIPTELQMEYNARVHSGLEEIWDGTKISRTLFESVKTFIQTKLPVSVSTFDTEVIYSIDPQNILRIGSGLLMELKKIISDEIGASSETVEIPSEQTIDTLFHQLKSVINKDKLTTSEKIVQVISSMPILSKKFTDNIRLIELESILKEYEVIPHLERLTPNGVVYNDSHGKMEEIPYEMHGEGFFTLLRLLYLIQEAKDGVLLIEEPENHMHPGYLSIFVVQLVRFAQKLNVQVFMTTHSSDLITEFAHYPSNDEEEELIQISSIVQRNGNTELYTKSPRAAQKTLDELRIDLRGV